MKSWMRFSCCSQWEAGFKLKLFYPVAFSSGRCYCCCFGNLTLTFDWLFYFITLFLYDVL